MLALREGKYAAALQRLAADGRLTEAASADAAFERLVAAWYAERQRRAGNPERRRSAMTAEHHAERRELNRRARAQLAADGTLSGPELVVGGLSFRAGDEVIARIGDRKLRAEWAPRGSYVRNGSLGRVVEVGADGVVVDFERWGRVTVSESYLEQALPGGGSALQHAYAVTTHAAQGETFAKAATLVTDKSTPAGLYVAVTRGQYDLAAEILNRAKRVESRRMTSRHSATRVAPSMRRHGVLRVALSRSLLCRCLGENPALSALRPCPLRRCTNKLPNSQRLNGSQVPSRCDPCSRRASSRRRRHSHDRGRSRRRVARRQRTKRSSRCGGGDAGQRCSASSIVAKEDMSATAWSRGSCSGGSEEALVERAEIRRATVPAYGARN